MNTERMMDAFISYDTPSGATCWMLRLSKLELIGMHPGRRGELEEALRLIRGVVADPEGNDYAKFAQTATEAPSGGMTQHKRTESIKKEVVYAVTCDGCGKRQEAEGGWTPRGWHRFNSQHAEWGNDSIESIEYFDVCSFECYLTVMRRTYDEIGVHPTFEADEKDREFVADMLARFSHKEGGDA